MVKERKISVSILEHSPDFAALLSRLVDEAGFMLSNESDSDVVIIGPSIDVNEMAEKYYDLHDKGYVLIVSENDKRMFSKVSTLFEIITPNSLDLLEDAIQSASLKCLRQVAYGADTQMSAIANLFNFEEDNVSLTGDRIHNLLLTLPMGIIIVSRDKGVVGINQQACEILNITYDEIKALSYEEFHERFSLFPGGDEVLSSLEDTDRPMVFIRHLKSDTVVEVFMSAIKETGEFSLILNDVTEQNREQEWLQGLLGAIGDGVLVLDRERRIVWSNKIIHDWFGDKLSIMPTHCFNIWAGSDRQCPNCPIGKTFQSGEICQYEERFVDGESRERYFDIIAAPIRTADGRINQVVQLAREVTDKEHLIHELKATKLNFENANRQLKRQYGILRTIMELSDILQQESSLEQVMHITLTAATAKEGLGFNRAFMLLVDSGKNILKGEAAVGPSNAEEAGRIWANLSDVPRSLAQTLIAYKRATKKYDTQVNRIVRSFEIPLDSDDFLIKCLNVREPVLITPENSELMEQAGKLIEKIGSQTFVLSPLWTMTKPVGILIVDNLITQKPITNDDIELLKALSSHASLAIERSMLTDELQESYVKLEKAYDSLKENQQRLVEAEKLSVIGKITAQIAHEIRNPLVSIGGFARSLMDEASPQDPNYEPLKIIVEETERLERIIKDVLGFTKLKKLELKQGDINQIIFDTLLLFEPELEESNIHIETDIDETIPPFKFDGEQIRQVFINIIRNSLNVLTAGGKIFLSTRCEGNYCKIEIGDNGPGIPKEYGEKIFKPFFTTRTSGTGLGLSISAQIIHAHDGQIWYNNNPTGGVTFHIRLPLKSDER